MVNQTTRAGIDCQVLIVGGGPVGLGLAIELGQRGISVTVIERQTAVHRVPKGQNLNQRSGEHFQVWGVSKAIRAAAPIPHEYGSSGVTAYGTLLGPYTYDWYARAEVRPYYFADNERLPQYETETVLRHRASQLDNVTIHYGWTAENLRNQPHGVSVDIASPDQPKRSLSAEYLIGCDGGGSATRDLAGISMDTEGYDRRMVLLVFKSLELDQLLSRFPGKSFFNIINPKLDGYWQFLGRVDLRGTWFFHAPVPPGETEAEFDIAGLLSSVVGSDFALEVHHVGFWSLQFAIAKSYRNGRVFIAGDAAHLHPPYGGYGINLGFEDARNLGWKLAAVLKGWGGAALLDSYSAERRPVYRSTAKDFIRRLIEDGRKFIGLYDPTTDLVRFQRAWAKRASGGNADVKSYAPHYEGSPIVDNDTAGPPSAIGQHGFEARSGHHLPPHSLTDGKDLFDALETGFTLISMGGTHQVAQSFIDAARRLGVPLTVIEQSVGSSRNNYRKRYILVRPDHFIAWTGKSNTMDAAAVIRRAIGHSVD